MLPRQSNNQARFGCTVLKGTNKKGILPKDEFGYYTMPIGGLNVFNSSGDYYAYDGARQLFESSSSFMRRVQAGCLKGELGHPKPLPGQSLESYAQRIMTVEETNIAVHFSEIWLDFESIKDKSGRPVISIMAKLCPSGPHANALERSLNNPKEDTGFSIRSFTSDEYIGGVKTRTLKQIVTHDAVLETGISFARKYYAPTLESLQDDLFTKNQLSKIILSNEGLGLESSNAPVIELFTAFNWNFNDTDAPSFTKW